MIDYDYKTFRPIQNTANGETSGETLFHYRQTGRILTAEYAGGEILAGHLIGLVDEQGNIDMRYHQVNIQGELMTGICRSTPKTPSLSSSISFQRDSPKARSFTRQ